MALLFASGFGLGYLPKAPGTWGSLAGALCSFVAFLAFLSMWLAPVRRSFAVGPVRIYLDTLSYCILAVVIGLFGVWVSEIARKHFQNKDPQIVVIDEISGQFLTFVGARFDWQYLVAGFILFRIFDIWKPWPARQAENLPGGWGIMADDWVAGIYAGICLWALRTLGL